MTTVLAVSIGLPVIAALMWSARRQIFGERVADTRGVALQTVIVIVVMLVIAGAVAGVLLTRGGDVVSDLEGQEVGPVTADNCEILEVSGVTGVTHPTAAGATPTHCVWTNATTTAAGDKVTRAACTVVGGEYKQGDAATITLGGVTYGVTTANTVTTGCEVDLNA